MKVRAPDTTPNPDGSLAYDMQFGHGARDFLQNVPAAPAQCVLTRLVFWQGQWFLNIADGTPFQTAVLGKRTEVTRDPAMRARVLGTQGITAIGSYASQVNRVTRAYSVQVAVKTAYGPTVVAVPTSAANLPVYQDR